MMKPKVTRKEVDGVLSEVEARTRRISALLLQVDSLQMQVSNLEHQIFHLNLSLSNIAKAMTTRDSREQIARDFRRASVGEMIDSLKKDGYDTTAFESLPL